MNEPIQGAQQKEKYMRRQEEREETVQGEGGWAGRWWDKSGKEEPAEKTEIKVKYKNLFGKMRQRKSKTHIHPAEMTLNFLTVLLRTLLSSSSDPYPLTREDLRRNGQPLLQAWKSSCVKGRQTAPRDQLSS